MNGHKKYSLKIARMQKFESGLSLSGKDHGGLTVNELFSLFLLFYLRNPDPTGRTDKESLPVQSPAQGNNPVTKAY